MSKPMKRVRSERFGEIPSCPCCSRWFLSRAMCVPEDDAEELADELATYWAVMWPVAITTIARMAYGIIDLAFLGYLSTEYLAGASVASCECNCRLSWRCAEQMFARAMALNVLSVNMDCSVDLRHGCFRVAFCWWRRRITCFTSCWSQAIRSGVCMVVVRAGSVRCGHVSARGALDLCRADPGTPWF